MNDDFLYAGALGTLEPRLASAGSVGLASGRHNGGPSSPRTTIPVWSKPGRISGGLRARGTAGSSLVPGHT